MAKVAMIPLNPGFKPPPRGEDLPCSDGEPMETWRHKEQMNLLIAALNDHWRDRDDFYVDGNMFVYFSELQAKHNDFRGPDVFVVLDTTWRERKSWVVWEEGGRTPDVVIELLSESTERVDRGEKMEIYAKQMRVAEYYLFDPWTAVFEGYALDPSTRSYRRRPLDEQGRLPSPVTGLMLGVVHGTWAGVETDWLRWLTPDGQVVPTAQEREAARAEREARRAEREATRAQLEAARAEQEAARAEREATRAEQEIARAAQAEARAAEAEAAREAALRRVEELEARLGKR